MASPMPLVPPVTSACFPLNSVSEEVLIWVSPLELPVAAYQSVRTRCHLAAHLLAVRPVGGYRVYRDRLAACMLDLNNNAISILTAGGVIDLDRGASFGQALGGACANTF